MMNGGKWVPAGLVLATACGGADGTGGNGAARDSAGIEIVENAAGRWSETTAWRLAETPTLDLGGPEGDSAHEFYQVSGMVRLGDGTIVVANNGTSELRFFAADGTPVRKVGRKGAGPGEFQTLMGLHRLAGDSLLAYDPMNRRLTLLDAAGGHVRAVTLPAAMGFMFFQLEGRFPDGTYLVFSPSTQMGPDMLNRPLGPARDSVRLMVLDSAAAPADTLGTFPAGLVVVKNLEMFGRSFPMPVPVPFSPTTVVAAGPDAVYVGTTDSYEIRVLARDGTLRRLIRRNAAGRVVTQADRDEMAERMKELPGQAGQMAAVMEQFQKAMADVEYPATLPAYSQLLVDAEGNLWVADHPGARTTATQWTIFDRDGRMLGTLTMPERFRPREIGADYVLGQMTDETEIEHVQLYQLIKPG